MRKAMMILLSVIPLIAGIAMMGVGERTLTAGVFSILLLVVAFLYQLSPWLLSANANGLP